MGGGDGGGDGDCADGGRGWVVMMIIIMLVHKITMIIMQLLKNFLELNCMENLELGEEASFDLSTPTISNASLAAENSSGANSNNQGLGEEPPFDIHAYLNKEPEDYQEEHPRIQGSTKKSYADMQFTGETVTVPEETYQRLNKN